MIILKICTGTWNNASRDQRELNICKDLGMEVIVLAKGDVADKGREDNVNGFCVLRYTTRPFPRVPVILNRLISIFQWARFASSLEPDIISGHDISGWIVGWMSRLYSRKKKPKLVYDSHEFELGRNAKRNKLQLVLIKHLERKAIKKSSFTIVVNDSIADELVKIYKLKRRPLVVRNIPDRWDMNPDECVQTRRELMGQFHGDNYTIMYHGGLCKNRGIEQLLEAVNGLDAINLLLIGNPESEGYMNFLKANFIDGMSGKVVVMPAVLHAILWKYIGAVDLCVAPIIPKCRSYYFALPNKLFEAIQAGTPLLVSDLPEMKRIVEGYKIGECVDSEDVESLKRKILEMKANGKEPYIEGLAKARDELTWENEKKALSRAYSQMN